MTEGGDGGGGAGGDERDWAIWLRLLSHSVRDTSVSASTDDTAVLQAVEIPSLPSFLPFIFFLIPEREPPRSEVLFSIF
jgi:hypothetical protein